jgi:hypothetical protein
MIFSGVRGRKVVMSVMRPVNDGPGASIPGAYVPVDVSAIPLFHAWVDISMLKV